ADDPSLRRPVVAGLPYVYAEVAQAVTRELACALSDVMVRRLRLIHEDAQHGLGQAAEVAAFMGPLLDWTPAEHERQLADYRRQVALTEQFNREPRGINERA